MSATSLNEIPDIVSTVTAWVIKQPDVLGFMVELAATSAQKIGDIRCGFDAVRVTLDFGKASANEIFHLHHKATNDSLNFLAGAARKRIAEKEPPT